MKAHENSSDPNAGFAIGNVRFAFGHYLFGGPNKKVLWIREGGVNKHVVLPDEYQTADGSTIASGKSVKLTVIYKDNAYYMYLDGVCYLTVTGDEAAAVKTAIGTEGDIAIKLVSEHHAAFSNVILSTDVVEIESYLSAHSGS